MNLLLIAFSQAAIRHTLFISKQEIINDSIIGLDGKNRKLLVVYQNEDNIYDEVIINLEEVERITVESVTAIMDAGHSKNARTDQFLEKVVLRFYSIQEKLLTTFLSLRIRIVYISCRNYNIKQNNGKLHLNLY